MVGLNKEQPAEHSAESEQMAALYALDALDDEARFTFERHLASCAECRRIVEQDRQTLGYLSVIAPEREPPARLRGRLMDAVAADIGRHQRARPTPEARHGWTRPRLAWTFALPLAACLMLLLGGWLGYRVALDQVLFSVPLEGPAASRSTVDVHRSGATDVELRGLPDPAPGHLYVVWLEQPSGGYEFVGSYDDGNGTCPLERPVLGGRLVLTEELAALPPAPTSSPLLWATIQAQAQGSH